MQPVEIKNLTRPLFSHLEAVYCASFLCRLKGLTFRSRLPAGEALLLVQAMESRFDSAIHMLFVGMDLSVIWLDRKRVVVERRKARRWRPIYIPSKPARYVLEAAPERLLEFEIGDQLYFHDPT
jgi:uncharacterized membrane protein (UPF0127 family)